MGKLATVVYDAVDHKALVSRTRVATPAERYGVIDAVSAFAHHCEMLRGVARSPVQVSAMWGGPPYITYQVVRSRFRIIVMWTDAPGDFDIAFDVQDALIRLHAAVTEVAQGLVSGDPAAIAYAYRVAGLVLHDAHVQEILPSEDVPAVKKPSAFVDAAKKALPTSATSESKKSGLLRNIFSSRSRKGDSSKSLTKSSQTNTDSHILSGLSVSETLSLEGSIPIDDEQAASHLDLPDEVFAFSDGSAQLPESAGDLKWVALLVQGMEKQKVQPPPPVVRDVHTASSELADNSVSTSVIDSSDVAETESDGRVHGPSTTASSPAINASYATATIAARKQTQARPDSSQQPTTVRFQDEEPDARSNAYNLQNHVLPTVNTHPAESVVANGASSPSYGSQPALATPSRLASQTDAQLAGQRPQFAPVDSDFDVAALGDYRDEAASSITGTETESETTSSQSSRTTEAIRARMNAFANTMQAGNFALALQQVSSTLLYLSHIQPIPTREIITCASYFQALKILARVRILEEELSRFPPNTPDAMRRTVDLAVLTMFLAERKDLLPRHSVAAKKMAVEKNIVAGNFGMAARWLRSLIEAAPANQKQAFAQKLQLCLQNRELNTHMPASKWFCFDTLLVIPNGGIKCNLCPAVFAPARPGINPGQMCPVCHADTLAVLAG